MNKNIYEGKEKDLGTNYWYNTARYFNVAGRFTQAGAQRKSRYFIGIDPLRAKYPNISPYVRVANNPFRFVDRDGREITDQNQMSTGGHVIVNNNLVHVLKLIDAQYANDNNLSSSEFKIVVSGGDRYRDQLGIIRSTTEGSVVEGSSKTSPHLKEQGRRAVDISGKSSTVSFEGLKNAANKVSELIGRSVIVTKTNPKTGKPYKDGHYHIHLGKESKNNDTFTEGNKPFNENYH